MKAVTSPRALPHPLMLLSQVESARVSQRRQRRRSRSSLSQTVSRSQRRYVLDHLVRYLLGHFIGPQECAWSWHGEIGWKRDRRTCPRVLTLIRGEHMYHTRSVLIGGIFMPRDFGNCWTALIEEILLVDTDRLALPNEAYFSTHLPLSMVGATNCLLIAIELGPLQSTNETSLNATRHLI